MAVPDNDAPRIPWLVLVASGIALVILLSLGTWQVKRLAWKENLLATIAERMAGEPRPLADVAAMAASGGDVDYIPVRATGRFLHKSEQFFFATFKGMTGWYVYTPLELADGSGTVFVNRGFVPYDDKGPATRPEGQVEGEVTVTGLARVMLEEKPGFVVPDNDPAKNIFYWKDLTAMAANAGLGDGVAVLPLFVDADATPNPGGLPIGGVTQVDLPNSHLQYAITWYGLALALAAVTAVFVRRRYRRDAPQHP